jgi:hypothetical protein
LSIIEDRPADHGARGVRGERDLPRLRLRLRQARAQPASGAPQSEQRAMSRPRWSSLVSSLPELSGVGDDLGVDGASVTG